MAYGSFAVLSDPAKRLDYDITGNYEIDKYTLQVRISIVSSGLDLSTCFNSLWLCDSSMMHPNYLGYLSTSIQEYLTRFKGMILTCNGLGMSHSSIWYISLTI